MVDAKVIEALNFFSGTIQKSGIRIHDLILFGSSSTGTASPGSDIDIAVISDDFLGKDIFDRALLTKDAEMHTVKKFKVPLDVITLTLEEYQDQKSLFFNTLRKGVALSSLPLV
jgi:predicted nucleotidyltransferase